MNGMIMIIIMTMVMMTLVMMTMMTITMITTKIIWNMALLMRTTFMIYNSCF